MSGRAFQLPARYDMPGIDLAFGATRQRYGEYIPLPSAMLVASQLRLSLHSYGMSETDSVCDHFSFWERYLGLCGIGNRSDLGKQQDYAQVQVQIPRCGPATPSPILTQHIQDEHRSRLHSSTASRKPCCLAAREVENPATLLQASYATSSTDVACVATRRRGLARQLCLVSERCAYA